MSIERPKNPGFDLSRLRQLETELIEAISMKNKTTYEERDYWRHVIKQATNELSDFPFGYTSEQFRNDSGVNKTFDNNLWMLIEKYIHSKDPTELVLIEKKIDDRLANEPGSEQSGTKLLPLNLVEPNLIKMIYLSNNPDLIKIFSERFPLPNPSLFKGHTLPDIIAQHEQKFTSSMPIIKALLDKGLEKHVINAQRKYRGNERQSEEVHRVAEQYQTNNAEAKEFLADANKPYVPQCDSMLAERIVKAAEHVNLFSSVRHLTAPEALPNIFDDALYGRRTLLKYYLPFKPASLSRFDVEQGDVNVICFGANQIDPNAAKGIEMVFDLEKISKDNPCIFFKQKDLGFEKRYSKREIKIGELTLNVADINKNDRMEGHSGIYVSSKLHASEEAQIKNVSLISYNLEKIHQILTLNFFRYIDNLVSDGNTPSILKNTIYTELGKLSDEQLMQVLQDIGKKMTNTMEFNFYGAHKINFSTLMSIKKQDHHSEDFKLNLKDFVNALRVGDIKILEEAREKIPEIFKSYRFIDYLISRVGDEQVVNKLNQYRTECDVPTWKNDSPRP